MEKSILVVLAIVLSTSLFSQENPREFEMTEGDTTYVMKQYMFCMYLSGAERSQSDEEKEKIQSAHLAHLNMLAEEHNLFVAGPFGDDSDKRGVLLFDLETVEEAEDLVSQDPAVQAKRLDFECHPVWLAKGTVLP